MQINTTMTTLSMTAAMTPALPTHETSFAEVLHAVDPSASKHARKPFPVLQKLIEIVEQAAAQGKITATKRDEYLAILDEIHQKLEEIKDPRHPLCKDEDGMQMKHLLAEDRPTLEDPLFASMPTQAVQTAAAFLFQTEFVSFETDALEEFKTWVEKMIEEGNLLPKAKETFDAFVALRERFVAMLIALQEAFATPAPANTLSESEAAARFMSGIVQKPATPTTTAEAESPAEAEPEVLEVLL